MRTSFEKISSMVWDLHRALLKIVSPILNFSYYLKCKMVYLLLAVKIYNTTN